VRVSIDQERCQGHARCAILASTVFDVDDDGRGVVIVDEVPAEDEAEAQQAVASCPESAISVIA
jgi:ferredoxin